jgi:putative FmdB family regulatory protein
MPIYAYKCSSCGVSKDILRKISEPPLTLCPACGSETLAKQVTAAGFQLKGSGWYVTDFKGGASPSTVVPPVASDAAAAPAPSTTPAASPAPAATAATTTTGAIT